MKKIKTTVFAVIFIIFGFILGACGSNIYASNDKNEKTNAKYIDSFSKDGGIIEIFEYIDQETGVNYIIVGTYNQNKGKYYGISITPKLNSDGSLCIVK